MDKAGGESIPGRETAMQRHGRETLWHVPGRPFLFCGKVMHGGEREEEGVQGSGGHRRCMIEGHVVTLGTLVGLSLIGSGWLLKSSV